MSDQTKNTKLRETPWAPANQSGKLGSYSDGAGQKGLSSLETQLKGVSLIVSFCWAALMMAVTPHTQTLECDCDDAHETLGLAEINQG